MRSIPFFILCLKLSASQFDSLAIESVKSLQFNEYRVPDVVECVQNRRNLNQQQRIVFMGDSRIRQQFYSFVQMFPDNDFQWDGASSERMKIQSDMDAQSELLNIRISFRWRNILNEAVFNDFKSWLSPNSKDRPSFLIIGIALHYLNPKFSSKAFLNDLTTLEPLLRRLTSTSTVIWMNQLPIMERHIEYLIRAPHEQSFHVLTKLNAVAQNILGKSSVLFWNSSYALAFEYNRACGGNFRTDRTWYYLCTDHVHTGYVAIYQTTQQLLKFICSKDKTTCKTGCKK